MKRENRAGKAHQDKIEKCRLVYFDEVLIPGLDFVLRCGWLVIGRLLVIDVILAILYYLGQNLAGNVR